ncbi:MAG: hypothetical protein HFE54_06605, partial [Turicibacter sp.]|nr:hypothetical protein [Turicibacter sp.]
MIKHIPDSNCNDYRSNCSCESQGCCPDQCNHCDSCCEGPMGPTGPKGQRGLRGATG